MICNDNYLADTLRVCKIKDLIWVMRFQSPFVYIVCHDYSHHLLKYFFGICLCSISILLLRVSNLLRNGHFPIFVTIATVKVESMPNVYTWTIVLIN